MFDGGGTTSQAIHRLADGENYNRRLVYIKTRWTAEQEQVIVGAMIEKILEADDETKIDSIEVSVMGQNVSLKEVLDELEKRLADSSPAALELRKAVLELARQHEAKRIEREISNTTQSITRIMEQAEKVIEIRSKGTNEDYKWQGRPDEEKQAVLERMLAEYECFRRTFRPDLEAIKNWGPKREIPGLEASVKRIFTNLEDAPINEDMGSLHKFLYLIRLGADGKVRFSEIGTDLWQLDYLELKEHFETKSRKHDCERSQQIVRTKQQPSILGSIGRRLSDMSDKIKRMFKLETR